MSTVHIRTKKHAQIEKPWVSLDIQFLDTAAEGYRVTLTFQVSGETVLSAESIFASPWEDDLLFKEEMVRVGLDKDYGTLAELRRRRAATASAGTGFQEPIRMIENLDERNSELERIGHKLFSSLVGPAADHYVEYLQKLDAQSVFWIRLINLPTDLILYPWEAMHDGNEFLALQPRIVVCRYTSAVGTYMPVPDSEKIISVYVITSSPKMPTGFQDILADRRKSFIRKYSREKSDTSLYKVEFWDELGVLGDVRADLLSKLTKGQLCRVVHFIGHGAYFTAEHRSTLFWQRPGGEADPQPAKNIMTLLYGNAIRLVVLDACETVHAATELTSLGLPVAIGMLQKLRPYSGELFCEGLYQGLSWGFDIADCLRNAREHMRVNNSEDWLMPVLVVSVPPPEVSLAAASSAQSQKEVEILAVGYGQNEWITVSSGTFWMGSDPRADPQAFEDEIPQHLLRIPYDFAIARYPTTVAEFLQFVSDKGYDNPEYWSSEGWAQRWRGQWSPPVNGKQAGLELDMPITGVSWFEAMAFCKWLSTKTGTTVRLPTEAEWEKAARGTRDKRIYPWGNFWDPSRCNTKEGGIGHVSSVRAYDKSGCSPLGCCDMVGNVLEWTASKWSHRFKYPYIMDDGREETGNDLASPRVLRGGSFLGTARTARCSYRTGSIPDSRSNHIGFRVVRIG